MAEPLALSSSTAKFKIKQGDVLPVLTDAITYSDGSTAPSFTGASVSFVMRALTANNVTTNTAATLGNSATAASLGGLSYTFTKADTATAGLYSAYWLNTGTGQVYPTDGYVTVEVEENLTTPGGDV